MLSSVPGSERAVQMNILIIRAFVKIREMLATNKDLAARMEKIGPPPRFVPNSCGGAELLREIGH